MLILDTTGKSLEFVLGAAVAANQLPFVAAYADHTASAFTPAANDGVSNNTTAVTLVAAPAASTQRQLKYLIVENADTATATVTVRLNNGGTLRTLISVSLNPGENLQFTDGAGWQVLDAGGAVKTATASLLSGLGYDEYRHVNGASSLSRYQVAGLVNCTVLTTGAPSAGNLRALPFTAPAKGGIVDQLAFNVTTLLAGNARIGLYRNLSPGNLYPGDLVAGTDTGAIATGTAGVKTASVNVSLIPGELYWLAHLSDVAATLRCLALANMHPMHGLDSALGTAPGFGITRAFAFAALPTPFGAGGSVISAVPIPALAYRLSA